MRAATFFLLPITSSAKIPFEWERLSDEGKVAFIDSTRKAFDVARASGKPATTTVIAGGPGTATIAPGGGVVGQIPQLTFVEPSELPDYKPPFSGGATRVDADGNLWIRTTQNLKGLPVYNVVNRKGELVDRVQLPAGRVLAGFGPGGVVYLGFREGDVARLEKARSVSFRKNGNGTRVDRPTAPIPSSAVLQS